MAHDERKNNLGPFRRMGLALRHGRNWLVVQEHHVGDIRNDQPVLVAEDAIVAGDIHAPKVVVSGLLYGRVQTDDLTVQNGGQIWGDVCTKALSVEAGGQIHGWVSTNDNVGLSETQFSDLPDEVRSLIDSRSQPTEHEKSAVTVAIWRQLQAAAAAALVSRKAIEREFEDRVEEVAGDSIAEAVELRGQIAAFQNQQAVLDLRLSRLQEMIQIRDEQLKSRAAELTTLQEIVDQREETIEDLQTLTQNQILKNDELETSRLSLESQFSTENNRAKDLAAKVENLESALQASLQHTSEMEESLVRWQELAELTENRARELEDEVSLLKKQLDASHQDVEILQIQAEKLEEEWSQADVRLREAGETRAALEASLGEADHEVETLRHEKQWLRAELSALKEQANIRPDDYDEFVARIAMAEQKARVQEEQLERAHAEAQTNYEKLLWSQSAHQAAEAKYEAAQQTIVEKDAALCLIEEKLAEQQAVADKWQTSVGRMTELLYGAEKKIKELEVKLAEANDQDDDVQMALREVARQRQLQLEAYEQEIENLHEQTENQGQRLADVQVALVEREITIDAVRDENETLRREIERVKKLASAHIRKLETAQQQTQEELARSQRKLSDISIWLERKRNRGEETLPSVTDSPDHS